MPSYDDDYVDLLADQLGERATTEQDLARDLEHRPLTEAPLELERTVGTARWMTAGGAPPGPSAVPT